MFGTLGGPELFLIFVVALIVFGPRKLPEIGKSLGKMMAEFRRASNEFRSTIESEVEAEKIRDSMRIESPKSAPAYPVETAPGSVEAAPGSAETASSAPDATAAGEADPASADAPAAETAPPGTTEPAPAADGTPDAPREPVPETVSRQPEPIEPK
jgi:Tat protein translocase TatB subunit